MSRILIENDNYSVAFKDRAVADVRLLSYSLSLMSRDELISLNNMRIFVEPIGNYNDNQNYLTSMFNFYSLLKYYSNKHNIDFINMSLLHTIASRIEIFKNELDGAELDTIRYNNSINRHIAEILPIFSKNFNNNDYDFVLLNLGVTEQLTNRPDFDIHYVIKWVSINQYFKLTQFDQSFTRSKAKYNSFERAIYSVKNPVAHDNFFKLLPYYILYPQHQYLLFSNYIPLFKIFDTIDLDKIQSLYDGICGQIYPMYSNKELASIKKRIVYTFRNTFDFKDGIFSAIERSKYDSSVRIELKGPTYSYWNRFNYKPALDSVTSILDIEKIILVAGGIPDDETANVAFSAGEHCKLAKIVLDIIDEYDIEKSKTAIALSRDWHGTKEDFISMMEVI